MTKYSQAAATWLTTMTFSIIARVSAATATEGRASDDRDRGDVPGLGDDHRDDGHRGDRPARGLPTAGRGCGPERLRIGVRGRLRPSGDEIADCAARRRRPRWPDDGDRGSAVAEFALVLVLLLLLFLALVSVGLWAYTRTLLTSAAADAARESANFDASPQVANARVRELLGDGLTGATRATLVCTSSVQGLLVTVHCTMEAPGIVGLLDGVMPTIDVTGHSAKETLG